MRETRAFYSIYYVQKQTQKKTISKIQMTTTVFFSSFLTKNNFFLLKNICQIFGEYYRYNYMYIHIEKTKSTYYKQQILDQVDQIQNHHVSAYVVFHHVN